MLFSSSHHFICSWESGTYQPFGLAWYQCRSRNQWASDKARRVTGASSRWWTERCYDWFTKTSLPGGSKQTSPLESFVYKNIKGAATTSTVSFSGSMLMKIGWTSLFLSPSLFITRVTSIILRRSRQLHAQKAPGPARIKWHVGRADRLEAGLATRAC